MTKDEINSRIATLQKLRAKAEYIERLHEAQKILDSSMSGIMLARVLDNAEYGLPIDLSLMLNEHENEVLSKAIWIIIDYAIKRLEQEMNEK